MSLDVRNTCSMVGNVGLTLMFTDVYKEQECSFLWSIGLRKREGVSEHDSSLFQESDACGSTFCLLRFGNLTRCWSHVSDLQCRFNIGTTLCESRSQLKCDLDCMPDSLCRLLSICQAYATFSKYNKHYHLYISPLYFLFSWSRLCFSEILRV